MPTCLACYAGWCSCPVELCKSFQSGGLIHASHVKQALYSKQHARAILQHVHCSSLQRIMQLRIPLESNLRCIGFYNALTQVQRPPFARSQLESLQMPYADTIQALGQLAAIQQTRASPTCSLEPQFAHKECANSCYPSHLLCITTVEGSCSVLCRDG